MKNHFIFTHQHQVRPLVLGFFQRVKELKVIELGSTPCSIDRALFYSPGTIESLRADLLPRPRSIRPLVERIQIQQP